LVESKIVAIVETVCRLNHHTEQRVEGKVVAITQEEVVSVEGSVSLNPFMTV
jgi:hypothetical protein